MNWKKEYKPFLWIVGFFLFAYFMPLDTHIFKESIYSALQLTKWDSQEHVLLCLIPAFFIAGVIAVFISQAAVIKYFGANAKKWLSYSIASGRTRPFTSQYVGNTQCDRYAKNNSLCFFSRSNGYNQWINLWINFLRGMYDTYSHFMYRKFMQKSNGGRIFATF